MFPVFDWSSSTRRGRRTRRAAAAAAVLLALVVAPAPLLPPHGLAEAVQRAIGVQWKAAYLLAAVGLQVGFNGSLGILASFAVRRPHTPRKRLIRIVAVPAALIAATIVIRLFRLGHLPVLANVIVPLGACTAGVVLGLIGRFRGWGVTAGVAVCVAAAVMWGWTRGVPSGLAQATRADLQRLVEAGPGLPDGDARLDRCPGLSLRLPLPAGTR